MIERKELAVPFRGDRDYITGVDVLETSLDLVNQHFRGEPGRIRLSCYKMLRQSDIELVISSRPLSPKDHYAIVQTQFGTKLVFVGWNPGEKNQVDLRVECLEQQQLDFVEAGQWKAEIRKSSGVDGSLLSILVAAIKAASQKSFPKLHGKWIFASANLSKLPDVWHKATVESATREPSHFYSWNVIVDSQTIGSIVFFLYD